MKIAIDISPLSSGHKVRGVGFYLQYLKESLLTFYPETDYQFFMKNDEISLNTDLVHYPYFDPFFLTVPFVKKYKTVVTVHDLTPLVFPEHFPAGVKGNAKWQLQKFNLKKVDAIIADSHASKSDIVKITGVPEEKIFVTHLAAGKEFNQNKNSAMQTSLRKKYNLPDKFALYVGDVTWNKNVPSSIKACLQANIPLVLVGKSLVAEDFDRTNPWNNDLIEVEKLTQGKDTIIKLGFLPTDDLVGLYNLATVFLFPSFYEGFGLPVLEAMQSGCPVITSHCGSLKEVAADAGYIIDPSKIDMIIDALQQVFSSTKLQEELSIKGKKQAQKFSWEKTAKETIAVYNKVVQETL